MINLRFSKDSNTFAWILSFAICILIVLGLNVPLLSVAALFIGAWAVILLDVDRSMCVLFMCMSFANIFKTSAAGQSFFTYMFLLFVLMQFVRSKQLSLNISLTAVFAVYLFLGQMLGDSLNILRYIKFAANFLFIAFAYERMNFDNNKNLFLSYIMGVVMSSLTRACGLFGKISDYVAEKTMYIQDVQQTRFSGLYKDPNYYSVNVIIAMLLVVVLFHNKQIKGWAALVLSVALTVFAGMTASKSVLLMLLLPVFALLYSNMKKRRYFIQLTSIIALLLVVMFIINGKIGIFDMALDRLLNADSAASLTTGRTELWKKYTSHLISNPLSSLVGYGIGADLLGKTASHNTYIDAVYYLGVIGTVFMIFILVSICKRRNLSSRNFLNYSVLICIIIMYFSLGMLFYFDVAFHVMLAIILINTETKKQWRENDENDMEKN